MNATIIPSEKDPDIQIVKDATVYLTSEYATDLYNSCANVQFAGGGAPVMNILCGTTDCNPKKFLTFQGDPNLNGDETPFLISYKFENNTDPLWDGIVARDDTGIYSFYTCNETVPGKGVCSCSDCPVVCPLPPTFSQSHLPFMIIAYSVGSVGIFLSTIIFIAALTSSLYFVFFRKNSGYYPIDGRGSPHQTSTYGAIGDDRESSTSSNLNSDVAGGNYDEEHTEKLNTLGKFCQVGHFVEAWIKKIFYHWGRFTAKFWFLVVFVVIVITATLSFGLFFFTVTTDPVKLWSAPTSRARLEKNYYDENFRPFYRTEMILVKAKPFVEGFNISVAQTTGDVWTFGPVFNKSVLKEVGREGGRGSDIQECLFFRGVLNLNTFTCMCVHNFIPISPYTHISVFSYFHTTPSPQVYEIQNHLSTMQVKFNAGGNMTNITLRDICFSPLLPDNSNCTVESVLNYFQNNVSALDQSYVFGEYTYPYHIHYCTR